MLYAGKEISADTINLQPKWNIIGGPSVPVDTSMISGDSPGLVISKFFGFDSGYSTSTMLVPGKGYWVKASRAGKLIISPLTMRNSSNKIHIEETSELPPSPPEDIGHAKANQEALNIPKEFALEQNYPNPFNPSTVIRYQLPVNSYATLKVINLLGQEVITLVNGVEEPGYKSVEFDAGRLSSGIYFYRLTTDKFTQQKKMLLLK
jgi:hypothetical protein